jgi:hypothetical protein
MRTPPPRSNKTKRSAKAARKYAADSEPRNEFIDEYVIGRRAPRPAAPGQCWDGDPDDSSEVQQPSRHHRNRRRDVASTNRRVEEQERPASPVIPASPSTLPLHPLSGAGGASKLSKRAGFCFCVVVCVLVAGAVALSFFLR